MQANDWPKLIIQEHLKSSEVWYATEHFWSFAEKHAAYSYTTQFKRIHVLFVICTARKHVSLYNKILPLLSTESQRCKINIYNMNLQNKAILQGSMW